LFWNRIPEARPLGTHLLNGHPKTRPARTKKPEHYHSAFMSFTGHFIQKTDAAKENQPHSGAGMADRAGVWQASPATSFFTPSMLKRGTPASLEVLIRTPGNGPVCGSEEQAPAKTARDLVSVEHCSITARTAETCFIISYFQEEFKWKSKK
jgi:hypothetical protein